MAGIFKRSKKKGLPAEIENDRREKIRVSIGTKLISIISLILVLSLSVMIFLASYFFKDDNTLRIKETNHSIAELTALKVRTDLKSIVKLTSLFAADLSDSGQNDEDDRESTAQRFFNNNSDILFVGLAEKDDEGLPSLTTRVLNRAFLRKQGLKAEDITRAFKLDRAAFAPGFHAESVMRNISLYLKVPAVALSVPFVKNTETSASVVLIIFFSMDRFLEAVRSPGITTTFIVNGKGELIAHRDTALVSARANFSRLPIIKMMMKSAVNNGQTRYENEKGERFIGSFRKVGFARAGVVATVKEDKAFAAVYKIQKRNILITIIVLNLAILVVYFFSKTITGPISRLVNATSEIEKGNFEIEMQKMPGDELGLLMRSFKDMGHGLAEREKIKNAFGKFVNKEIAEQVLKGEIKLGGERKVATVFFSDIRSFTAISEKLEPEEVVEFLNQYMTRMVSCVNRTNGTVDKYIGDAIMAVWGAPVSHGNDTENALNGALLMRQELIAFNKGRGGDKKPIIRIGCGLNTGPVLAGQIGSEEKMEYTVIGDTVNLASRIEGLNKPFGTDILISQGTYDLVKDTYRLLPMQKIKVKGKTKPQQIYALLGRLDDPKAPKSLKELRALVGIPATGKPKPAADKEVKYEILD